MKDISPLTSDEREMLNQYRAANPNKAFGIFHGKDLLNELLDSDDVTGVRSFFGEDEDGNSMLIHFKEYEGSRNGRTEGDTGGDTGSPCPPFC